MTCTTMCHKHKHSWEATAKAARPSYATTQEQRDQGGPPVCYNCQETGHLAS